MQVQGFGPPCMVSRKLLHFPGHVWGQRWVWGGCSAPAGCGLPAAVPEQTCPGVGGCSWWWLSPGEQVLGTCNFTCWWLGGSCLAWVQAASLRLPQGRKRACPAAPGLCPLLTPREGHGGPAPVGHSACFCPLGHCPLRLPTSQIPGLPRSSRSHSPSCPPFPSGCPLLEAGRSWEDKHRVPFLPVCFLRSWPRFPERLPKKTKVAPSRFAYTRTHVSVWLVPS